jgi:MerR family transcriptional regulator, light-induced transcriptional regulator
LADKTHLYNLKAVINEVGLTPATLRAWERRYGLLKPQRSPGGHRLYSRQDIEMLKWLVNRQKEGLSISSAVEMWKNQAGSYQDLMHQFESPAPVAREGETLVDELRNSWIGACLAFNDQAANQVLDQAFSIAAPETVCTAVLQKGLAMIGDQWYTGTASVQHEHFASAIATRRINALIAAIVPPNRAGRILIACPPGEVHGFILLMATFLLRRRGWDVVYLGADVPLKDLDHTIRSVSPSLIVSAAQTLTTAASLRLMSETVARHSVPLAYGGGIFVQIPAATSSISGYYLGNDIAQVPQEVDHLICASPSISAAQAVTTEYVNLLAEFKQSEALIRAFVVTELQARQFNPLYLEVANANLPQLIISALVLGDISFLASPIAGLNGLLENFGLTTLEVSQYYSTYSQAIERYLGKNGALIQAWLENRGLQAD